ncbi:MAG: aminotransferase class I/II-fold pyridoxal phosphate-dependent enzyme [Bacteroidales bacterium]
MTDRIYLSSPHMSGKEQKYIEDAFSTNWIAPLGPNVDGFEKELADYTNTKFAATLSSGTAALHLALIITGVGRSDEVLVSTFTFSASVNPIVYQGAIPVFIDSEPDTWNMDPELLEKSILDRIVKTGKTPKALILVHLYGMPAKLDEIIDICGKYNIPIIEDAAEALGSSFKNRKLGSFGSFGILSFNGNKIITTSGGGALLSNNKNHIEKARFLATQARDKAPYYQHSEIGYNYRMSNVLAGIGRGQLEVIEERVKTRREINTFYRKLLGSVEGIDFLTEPDSNFFSNYWLTTIVIDKGKTGFSNYDLMNEFEKNIIESRPLWKPMHLQPVFSDYPAYISSVSEFLFNNCLCLPSGSNMTDADLSRIENVTKGFIEKK